MIKSETQGKKNLTKPTKLYRKAANPRELLIESVCQIRIDPERNSFRILSEKDSEEGSTNHLYKRFEYSPGRKPFCSLLNIPSLKSLRSMNILSEVSINLPRMYNSRKPYSRSSRKRCSKCRYDKCYFKQEGLKLFLKTV